MKLVFGWFLAIEMIGNFVIEICVCLDRFLEGFKMGKRSFMAVFMVGLRPFSCVPRFRLEEAGEVAVGGTLGHGTFLVGRGPWHRK